MFSTLTILALALAAQAAPAPSVKARGTSNWSASAVHNTNYVRNGTAAMLKAYAKHHLTPTRDVTNSFLAEVHKRQDSSAEAVPADGAEYLVSTSVGGQSLNLDFDTGSADL